MLIKRTSQLTGITRELDLPITLEQIENWRKGQLIQNAMPNLSAADREFIISGITDDEWQEMVAGIDED